MAKKRSPKSNKPVAPRQQVVSRKKNFQKLRAMACFQEVHERICKGFPLKLVAEFIQDEREEYVHASKETLIRQLQKYRDDIPPAERAKYTMPKSQMEALEEVEEGIDELTEITKLYKRQLRRMDIDEQVEKNIGKLLPTMTQEVRVALEILHKSAQLKMDLGLNERQLGSVNVEATALETYSGTEIQKIIEDPKKRRRLLSIAEHALSMSDRGVDLSELDLSGGDDEDDEEEGEVVIDGD